MNYYEIELTDSSFSPKPIFNQNFKQTIKRNDKVNLVGALEINKEHIHWQGIELLPVRLQIVQ